MSARFFYSALRSATEQADACRLRLMSRPLCRSMRLLLWLSLCSISLSMLLPPPARAETAVAAGSGDITLVFAGDVMLAEKPGAAIRRGVDPFAEFSDLFARADVRIVNLECTVSLKGQAENKPYTFRAHPRVIALLKKHVSAVSLANNHSGDFGKRAFVDMLSLLERHQLPYFGGGRNVRDAHRPYLTQVRGRTIAVLGFDGFLPRSFEALDQQPGVAWLDPDLVVHQVRHAKEALKADLVIVFPHWGWEYERHASEAQRALAHLMIDSGADAVVGGHPHVTQDIEVYHGKPIFYSLGNFIFNGFDDEASTTGWVLQLIAHDDGRFDWVVHEARMDREGIPRRKRRGTAAYER